MNNVKPFLSVREKHFSNMLQQLCDNDPLHFNMFVKRILRYKFDREKKIIEMMRRERFPDYFIDAFIENTPVKLSTSITKYPSSSSRWFDIRKIPVLKIVK